MTRFIEPIDAATRDFEMLRDLASRQLLFHHVARVRNFPKRLDDFVRFVSSWGHPLPYYGGNGQGSHRDHPAVHRVRYQQEAAGRGELHALDGPLGAHSAQSLRTPRPGFFAMLMVDSGWTDGPAGTNGESVLVPWREVLHALASRFPKGWKDLLSPLMLPVPFPGGATMPIIYELPDARDDFDRGVRLKYGLLDWWDAEADVHPSTCEALGALLDEAQHPSVLVELPLVAGELIILDNNRWAHGRRGVRGLRMGQFGQETNPRELWSVTLQ